MIKMTVEYKRVSVLTKKLAKSKKKARSKMKKLSLEMAKDLVVAVQKNASGSPGPEVITGQYRSSIRILESSDDGNNSAVLVGTDAPQAYRLEFGFTGQDSLGRYYQQPAFPHWRPALAEIPAKSKKLMGDFAEEMME